MRVAGDETKAPQTLQVGVGHQLAHEPGAQAAALMVLQHVDIAEIRVCGPVGHDAGKADLTRAVEQAEAERAGHRLLQQRLGNALGPVPTGQIGMDGVGIHRAGVRGDAEVVPVSLECAHTLKSGTKAVL